MTKPIKSLVCKFIFFISVCSTSISYAKLENHFKKIEGKQERHHKIKNIDFIYLINLDQRPEKYQKCIDQLHPYGIYPYRFSAVNGWELSLNTINDIGVKFSNGMKYGINAIYYDYNSDGKIMEFHEPTTVVGRTYFAFGVARGAMGIALSHLSILQDAYDSGYKTIWVMEDDIELKGDPNQLSKLIKLLDKTVGEHGWDILFTDQDTRANDTGHYVPCYGCLEKPNFIPKNSSQYFLRKDINDTFRKVGARFGAYSMVIRRSGMKKILDFIKEHNIFLPYDLELYLPPTIKMFCLKNDLVCSELCALSDNGGPYYILDKK